ncbi:helix-turn-helix transcriptional regulator [Thiomonas bhubaneswarensis]|uniref:helix-turn-helix transcriptional regulator n=1 Tax=Thiomonas bhubaneswarensis TaxID=339866 RepID=UPI0009301A41|nr:helix-turn-helix transcriptional regulator [Thiomonas bhubaneswarensis]
MKPAPAPPSPAPSTDPHEGRRLLGEFIRLHRNRLSPAAARLPSTGRRRAPGLRREELASLCGVSATWITWLEQGRSVAASAKTLERLAQALQLSAAERAYLFELARRRDPSEPMAPPKAVDVVLRSVHAVGHPAYVLNQRWDVVAGNAPAADLFLDWQADGTEADSAEPPNLFRFLFFNRQARALIENWPVRSKRLVAEFRADCGGRLHSPPLRALIDEMCARSPEFDALWKLNDVQEREGGERGFLHPRHGRLVYEQLTLRAALHPDYKLVMLLPITTA